MRLVVVVAGSTSLLGACCSEPETARPAAALAPASAEFPAATLDEEWTSVELLAAPGSSGVRPPVPAIVLMLQEGVAGPEHAGEAPWRVVLAGVPGGHGGSGVKDSETARSIWDGQSLIIDVGPDIPDLGLRLVLTPTGGGWEGTWQRITIAGPVNGGPVRVRDAALVR